MGKYFRFMFQWREKAKNSRNENPLDGPIRPSMKSSRSTWLPSAGYSSMKLIGACACLFDSFLSNSMFVLVYV